jgi:RNA polymerase sigma-70 factor, ECF subfamily
VLAPERETYGMDFPKLQNSSSKRKATDCLIERPPAVSFKAAPQFEDWELTRRAQTGDADAFGELVTKYRFKIFSMICGMVRNEHDAWDLAQDGFVKAWHSIRMFQNRSSFYTWLYTITVRLTISSLRRKGHREEIELDDAIPCPLPGPSVDYQGTEIREQVNAALVKLSPEQRAVVVLKDVEDLEYHEIAAVMNLSLGTVMSRLFYGRKKLQSILRPVYNQNYQRRKAVSGFSHRQARKLLSGKTGRLAEI